MEATKGVMRIRLTRHLLLLLHGLILSHGE